MEHHVVFAIENGGFHIRFSAHHDDRDNAGRHKRRSRDVEAEVALLKDDGPVRKERLKESFEHALAPRVQSRDFGAIPALQ